MVGVTQEHARVNPDANNIIGAYADFEAGLTLGLEAGGREPATPEEIDRAFTVRKLAFAANALSENSRESAVTLLQETEGVRVKWTRELFDAATKLCAYYPFSDVAPDRPQDNSDNPDSESDHEQDLPQEPLGVDESQDTPPESLVASADDSIGEPVPDDVNPDSTNAKVDGDDSAPTDNLPALVDSLPNATPVSQPESDTAPEPKQPLRERPSRKQQAKNKLSIDRLNIPSGAEFDELPNSDPPRRFSELKLDEQSSVVAHDLANSFDVEETLVKKILARHVTGGFSSEELHLLAEIRERLCLQSDRKGVATSNGLLAPMKEFFRDSGGSVLTQLAGALGLKSELRSKKRVTVNVASQRLATTLGKSGNADNDYRNLLRGLRYIALCKEKTADDNSEDVD